MPLRRTFVALAGLLALTSSGLCFSQTTLVLRDLSTVETRQLSFDQEKVATAEGKTYGWDQVLQTKLQNGSRQQQFERYVRESGLPLFQMRHRLSTQDYLSLGEVVEPLQSALAAEKPNESNSRRHYLIHLAAFRNDLATGHRADALLSFLELCRIHKRFPAASKDFAAFDLSPDELEQGFTIHLLPIFFDQEAAVRVSSQIKNNTIRGLGNANIGKQLYVVALLIAAGETDSAKTKLRQLSSRSSKLVLRWRPQFRVQLEIAERQNGAATSQLKREYKSLRGPERALSNYLIAKQSLQRQEDYDLAILELLYIPANHDNLPNLSAAALHEAARISRLAGHNQEADTIRGQLLNRYPATYHGRNIDR